MPPVAAFGILNPGIAITKKRHSYYTDMLRSIRTTFRLRPYYARPKISYARMTYARVRPYTDDAAASSCPHPLFPVKLRQLLVRA